MALANVQWTRLPLTRRLDMRFLHCTSVYEPLSHGIHLSKFHVPCGKEPRPPSPISHAKHLRSEARGAYGRDRARIYVNMVWSMSVFQSLWLNCLNP